MHLPRAYYNCNGECVNDNNNNQICDELEIFGCMTNSACNYNEYANINDGVAILHNSIMIVMVIVYMI
ncbi:MAG: hypothetical protein CM15mP23_01260 [Cryomorphaceae bacterium]|nr:MAG: hypothetical protein CM15mP23_01260 [Cryomorphaceae bacterium]